MVDLSIVFCKRLDVGVHQEDKTICDNKVVTSYLGSSQDREISARGNHGWLRWLSRWEVVGWGWFSLTLRCWVKPDDKLTVHGDILVHLGTSWYILVHLGTSWYILVHFGTFWYILVHVLMFLPQWTMFSRCFHPTEALYRFELCPEELAGAATGRLVFTVQFSDRSKEMTVFYHQDLPSNKLTYHVKSM